MPAPGYDAGQHSIKGRPMTIAPPETKVVTAWRVSCDGGSAALGHPRVWLSIPHGTGFVDCGYCDCRDVHEDFKAH